MKKNGIQTLLCDIGGVLLTNGWGREDRKKAAETFKFDYDEFENRHRLAFDPYEIGKTTLEEYLRHAVFFKKRSFTIEAFIEFMYKQSQSFDEMLIWIAQLKRTHPNLKITLLSNEGRELTDYRLEKFKLKEFADFFIVSCFTGIRKPDPAIYRLALDLVQTPPAQIVYIDDRELFAEMGTEFGMQSIRHIDYKTTKAAVEALL
jgi:putative hydrolase of the HAD superfamily